MQNFCKTSPCPTAFLSQARYFSLGLPLLCFSSILLFFPLATNTSVTATFNFHYTCAKAYTAYTRQAGKQCGNNEAGRGCAALAAMLSFVTAQSREDNNNGVA